MGDNGTSTKPGPLTRLVWHVVSPGPYRAKVTVPVGTTLPSVTTTVSCIGVPGLTWTALGVVVTAVAHCTVTEPSPVPLPAMGEVAVAVLSSTAHTPAAVGLVTWTVSLCSGGEGERAAAQRLAGRRTR